MSSIQDIHAFEEKIYDIVQDYIDKNYDVDDVLAIVVNSHFTQNYQKSITIYW